MSDFIPKGYVPINEAFVKAMVTWGNDDFKEEFKSAKISGSGNYDTPTLDAGFAMALNKFRSALFAESLCAFQNDVFGSGLSKISSGDWVSSKMDGAISQGFYLPFGPPKHWFDKPLVARIFIKESDLDRLLNGETKPKGPGERSTVALAEIKRAILDLADGILKEQEVLEAVQDKLGAKIARPLWREAWKATPESKKRPLGRPKVGE